MLQQHQNKDAPQTERLRGIFCVTVVFAELVKHSVINDGEQHR